MSDILILVPLYIVAVCGGTTCLALTAATIIEIVKSFKDHNV